MSHIENYAALIEDLRRSTVQVLSGRGGGSGVVSDRGGLIVTNAHVAAGRYAEVVDAAGSVGERGLSGGIASAIWRLDIRAEFWLTPAVG